MEKLRLKHLSNVMGMSSEELVVLLSIPPAMTESLEYRARSFTELLINRAIDKGLIASSTGCTWAEVETTVITSEHVVVGVKFNACPTKFPMIFRISELSGTCSMVLEQLRKKELHLNGQLKRWMEVTNGGWKSYSSLLSIVRDMYKQRNNEPKLVAI